MSEAALAIRSKGAVWPVPFSPSAAGRGRPKTDWFSRDLMNVVLGSLERCSSPQDLSPRQRLTYAQGWGPAHSMATASEMADDVVRQLGLPVTALSDILNVERKTIYDWWRGAQANTLNHKRLQIVRQVFDGRPDGSGRFYHRLWKQILTSGFSLQEILLADDLDLNRARHAVYELQPAV